jgi:hypothetical protein
LSALDDKIERHVCIKFCVKLNKSATETPEMLHKAFGQWFLNGIHFASSVECPLKMASVQGGQEPAKRQKMLKKFENSSTKLVAEQSISSQTPLGLVMEFARRS